MPYLLIGVVTMIIFIFAGISKEKFDQEIYDFYEQRNQLIKECEKDIPRSQTCEIKMQAVIKGE